MNQNPEDNGPEREKDDGAASYEELKRRYRELSDLYERKKRENDLLRTGQLEGINRLVEVEQRSGEVSALYTASYELHSTLDINKLADKITEVAKNLLGAESVAVYGALGGPGVFKLILQYGVIRAVDRVVLGEGFIGRAAELAEPFIITDDYEYLEAIRDGDPVAVIPLVYNEDVLGLLSVYTILPHKGTFYVADMELIELVSRHAGLGLYNAILYNKKG
ncbi:MAG: GAF domain-containing protein [bacterium]|nr:GAF domain-containing protein [bacterium]